MMRRRDFLNAAGVAGVGAITTGFAGVTAAETDRHVATPVTLADAGELGYDERDRGEAELADVAPVNPGEATLVNQFAEYAGNAAGLGLVATPAPEVDGRQLNPLARMSPGEILAGEANGVLLRHLAVGGNRPMEWQCGPQPLDRVQATMLGQSTTVESFVGLTGENVPVLLTVARAEAEGDIVFAVSGKRLEAQSTSEGELNCDAIKQLIRDQEREELLERFASATERVRRHPRNQCVGSPSVEIVHPKDTNNDGYAEISQSKAVGENQWKLQFPAKANVSSCEKVTLKWSTKYFAPGDTEGGHPIPCPDYKSWDDAGTGASQTITLPDCTGYTPTFYKIRVQAVNNQGTVVDSDTVEVRIHLI